MNENAPQGTPRDPQRPHVAPRRSPTSVLPIVALILAAVPCCPAVSLAGAMLGMIALRRIQASRGTQSGRKIAQWAIGVGLGVAIVSTALWMMFTREMEITRHEMITEQIAGVVESAVKGETDQAIKSWNNVRGKTPPASAFEQFGSEALSRYGSLQRFSISSLATGGSLFTPRYEVAGVYIFERAERPGSAVVEMVPAKSGFWPQIRVYSIVIEDREKGDLKLNADGSGR